ncbi:MAG: DUF4373 domain-containing protein [Bacteroidales bacterium]|nr:DUF4373 domain-containing protein [Bacteroidales bacterium]MBD5362292.1 DUF4373 domain-containing protein [Bacteroides sp.]MBD5371778.1 DUF4373 domain-containing protein [Bacteroides sp.]
MKTFRHDINERNKSNVIKLRMKYGAAGYGVYMMLLERLAMEPNLRSDLDYDMLAYDFQESAELIRHVVEDFDLFIIDNDTETFSHEGLTSQLTPKARRAHDERLLDDFIKRRASTPKWTNSVAVNHNVTPDQVRALVNRTFRDKVLSSYTHLPPSATLCGLLSNLIQDTFGPKDD